MIQISGNAKPILQLSFFVRNRITGPKSESELAARVKNDDDDDDDNDDNDGIADNNNDGDVDDDESRWWPQEFQSSFLGLKKILHHNSEPKK